MGGGFVFGLVLCRNVVFGSKGVGVFEDGKGLKSVVMNDLAIPGAKRWG